MNQSDELMTPNQIDALRVAYSTISTIDPAKPTYAKLVALLDASSQARLKQLAGAGIKFVSKLAANRVTK